MSMRKGFIAAQIRPVGWMTSITPDGYIYDIKNGTFMDTSANGVYYVGQLTNPFGVFGRLDPNGTTVWQRTLGTANENRFTGIAMHNPMFGQISAVGYTVQGGTQPGVTADGLFIIYGTNG